MRKGTVKQFDPNSAYGFIEDDLTHSAYFVFYKSIKEEGYKKIKCRPKSSLSISTRKKRVYNVSMFMLIMTKRRN